VNVVAAVVAKHITHAHRVFRGVLSEYAIRAPREKAGKRLPSISKGPGHRDIRLPNSSNLDKAATLANSRAKARPR